MKEVKINVPDGYEIDKDKSTFENIVFKKKRGLPKNWEELKVVNGYYVDYYSSITPLQDEEIDNQTPLFKTKEQARASVALAKLSQLRDVYRQGWEPDWSKGEMKYCVIFCGYRFIVEPKYYESQFLSFQERQTAYLFLENFRDLIEQAKPLMS